jgi:hypothetical protein
MYLAKWSIKMRFLTVGVEIETGGISPQRFGNLLRDRGIKGFKSTYDASLNVDAEIVTCPFIPNQSGWEYLQNLCAAINSIGRQELGNHSRLINTGCGLHVHVSNAYVNDGICLDTYNRRSIEAFGTNGAAYHLDHDEPFDFALYKDVIYRYARQQSVISSMLAESRRNNRFCFPIGNVIQDIENASNLSEINSVLKSVGDGGKFSAITTTTYSRGTIEFRQHQGTTDALKIRRWVEFILNLYAHSSENRLTDGSRTIVTETPVSPFRANSRVGVQYAMMRALNGATTRDIMDATGCSEQRVRAAVSEIRARVGDAAVVTHTQQANGGRYGDGTDLTRYEVLQTFETQSAGMELLPENRRGVSSVWAGISDDHFEWWQDRIISLR